MATEVVVLCKESVAAPKHQMWCECGVMHERVGNRGAATPRAGSLRLGSPPGAASGAGCGLSTGLALKPAPEELETEPKARGEAPSHLGIHVGQAVPAEAIEEAAALQLLHDDGDELRVPGRQRGRVGGSGP